MNTKNKLTPKQKEIIELLKDGWELGKSEGLTPRVWIQKGGISKGGESKDLRIDTFISLINSRAIIISEEGFPISKYKLTETL